jgi:hypothetical protein
VGAGEGLAEGRLFGDERTLTECNATSQFDPQRTSTERAHEQHRSQLRAESFADFTTWVEISRSVQ